MGATMSCGTPPATARVLMAGLNMSGKTTLLYRLLVGQTVQTVPTIGFNVETLRTTDLHMTIWDVGGNEKLLHLWKHYTAATQVLIYVVDASDPDKLQSSKAALDNLLAYPDMQGVPIVVLLNKDDISGSLKTDFIHSELGLSELSRTHDVHVQRASAVTGKGLKEAMALVSRYCLPESKKAKQTSRPAAVINNNNSKRTSQTA